MHLLVTGSSGFVGGHLIPRCEAAGFRVTGTDREIDVSDADAVRSSVAAIEPDAIVHLAALSSVPASARQPELAFRVNFLGSRAVLEAATASAKPVRVVLIGSAEQYGSAAPGAPPFTEASPQRPRSPYAWTKTAADFLGAVYASRGLDVVRVRAFNHTGPGQADDFVLSSFARQVAEIAAGRREARLQVGNLDSVRDFLDIDDVVDAYLRLLDPSVPAGAYNVASGTGRRIGDLLDELIALAGVRPAIEPVPERMRPSDITVGDASRLRQATGWAPRVPLSRSLERLLAYWTERISAS